MGIDADLRSNIVKVLAMGGSPMTVAAVAKALPVGGRPTVKMLGTVLTQMTYDGLSARVPGKAAAYIATPIDEWARGALLKSLAAGPRSKAKLESVLPKSHRGRLGELLQPLLAAKQVFVHPPFGKGGSKYALQAADPLDYFAKQVDKLLSDVAKKGFTPAAVRAAALRHLGGYDTDGSEGDGSESGADTHSATSRGLRAAPDSILEAMRRLEPRVESGAAVSISRLRQALGGRFDKESFDSAVLLLANRSVVELQSHAWPTRLSAGEQKELIDNGCGGWFDSLALQIRKTA